VVVDSAGEHRPPGPHVRGGGALRAARLATAVLAALALGGCGRGDAARGAARRADRTMPPGAGVAQPAAGEARPVAAEVESTCAALAGWWRGDLAAGVAVADTAVPTPAGDTVAGCAVLVRLPHGMRHDVVGVAADGVPPDLGTGNSLTRSTGAGWVELVRYMADGPDGSSTVFQRGTVRCAVALRWDGGDDSDPAYVPEDWLEESTICRRAPEGVAVSDTAP
jgi:hypothetical protein